MKFFLTLCFNLLIVSVLVAQVTVSTPDQYDAYKQMGVNAQLTPTNTFTEPYQFVPGQLDLHAVKSGAARGEGTSECDCIKPIDDTYSIVPMNSGVPPEYRNDDASSPLIQLPFEFCLYGDTYNACYINNNGNITFTQAYATFSSSGFPNNQFIMVAPFWADVDTRNEDSGLPYYKITDHYMIVLWDQVGYFSQQADKLNTFQVIISDGTDPIIPNGGNVSFCYADMTWTTGSASGGQNGFGGTPATVGANKGDGVSYFQAGRFDQAGTAYDGPAGANDGVSWLDNLVFAFDACNASTGNLIPIAPLLTSCSTVYICAGNDIDVSFLGPEPDQTLDIAYTVDDPNSGLVFTIPPGTPGVSTLNISAPVDMAAGTYNITITATDNGAPPQAIEVYYTLVVIEAVSNIEILGNTSICSGQPTTLSIIPGFTNIEWSTGSGANSITVTEPGTYTVSGNLGGCDAEGSIVVELNEASIPTIQGESVICFGTQTTLTTTQPFTSYAWSNGASTQATNVGTGTHTVNTIDANGCAGSATFTINAYPVINVLNNFLVCNDLTANVTGNDLPGVWSSENNDVIFLDINDTDTEIEVPGYGEYVLTFTDSECNETDQVTVNFLPEPTFEYIPLADVCFGEAITIQPLTGNFSYIDEITWLNDGSTGQTFNFFTPDAFADSLIIWTAENDCGISRDTIKVTQVFCNLFIPNVFTPDGDQFNNALTFQGIDQYNGNTLKVWNRWGRMVYESDNYRNNWIPSEDEARDGVYYYQLGINRPSGMEVIEGNVTILRKR